MVRPQWQWFIALVVSVAVAPASAATGGPVEVNEEQEHDVIFVGSGLVGSAVAGRLSERLPQDRRILVLEAGVASHASLGGKRPPATWDTTTNHWEVWPGMTDNLTRYDVPGNYLGINCWDKECETAMPGAPAYTCKVLGGCGVMNGALLQYPPPAMFESWPEGWKWQDMKPYFTDVAGVFNATQTPSSDHVHYLEGAGFDFIKTALLHNNFTEATPLSPRQGTLGVPFVGAFDGKRQSTASLFLPSALARDNFELRLESTVSKILHDGSGRATGVLYTDPTGIPRTAALKADGIIVLSSGALSTPGMLLKSGIVPSNLEVGRGLTDHTVIQDSYSLPPDACTETFNILNPPAEAISQYVKHTSGALAQYGPTLVAFVKDANTTTGGPESIDVEVFVNPSAQPSQLVLDIVLMRPTCSSADLRLDGLELKIVNDKLHLACERDQVIMNNARQRMKDALHAVGANWTGSSPAEDVNHWASTCALGRCVNASTLMVLGSHNVAVADASLLPEQAWGHPAITLYAVALKAADVLEDGLRRQWSFVEPEPEPSVESVVVIV